MTQYPREFFLDMPKADLHVHLTGLIPPQMAFEAQRNPETGKVIFGEKGYGTVEDFLSDFRSAKTLDEYLFYYRFFKKPFEDPSKIEEIVLKGIEHYAQQNTAIVEIRASVNSLDDPEKNGITSKLDPHTEVELLLHSLHKATVHTGVETGLILCIRRGNDEKARKMAWETLNLALEHKNQGVLGIDLVGQELGNEAKVFQDVFLKARQAGLKVTIHAGEAAYQGSIMHALSTGAQRIGHGIALRSDKVTYEIVKHQQIPLEMCPTSNVLTKGVRFDEEAQEYAQITSYAEHPIARLHKEGFNVTVNTDGQSVTGTTITDELYHLHKDMGLSAEEVMEIVDNTIAGSFLPTPRKQVVRNQLQRYGLKHGLELSRWW